MEEDPLWDVQQVASEMQQRCRTLLQELQEFQDYLKRQQKEALVETRVFKLGLEAEMKLIDKLATSEAESTKTAHALRSSNLSFYEAVWSAAKHCDGITALTKRFFWQTGSGPVPTYGKQSIVGPAPAWKSKAHSQAVEIVAQNGLDWVKVSLVTEKRIIWDLAKAGWVGSSDESDGEDGKSTPEEDDERTRGLLKQAEDLVRASKNNRVRYQHPKVRIELPRLSKNCAKEVSDILQKIRKLGVTVLMKEDLSKPTPPISDILPKMTMDPFAQFSSILNIDCTILLAFVSDVSHGRVEPEHWHNQNISKQIILERQEQLLPNVLYPACGSHELVCIRDAAVTMLKIVELIGTEAEKKRTALLVEDIPDLSTDEMIDEFPTMTVILKRAGVLSRHQRLQEFQELSNYPVASNWRIPIQVVTADVSPLDSTLPESARTVFQSLTSINRSVFFYGWITGKTTLSSNGAVSKNIEKLIEADRKTDDEAGPDIWLCPITRSLVGKEKTRRGGKSAAAGAGDALTLELKN